MTANIHVVILVIDRNYDINDVMTANLVKSQEFLVIWDIHQDYLINDIKTKNQAKFQRIMT